MARSWKPHFKKFPYPQVFELIHQSFRECYKKEINPKKQNGEKKQRIPDPFGSWFYELLYSCSRAIKRSPSCLREISMVFLWYEAARFADEGLQPGTFFRMGDLFKADLCFTVNDGELNQAKWNIICIVYIYT
jgi:hypothetical protein